MKLEGLIGEWRGGGMVQRALHSAKSGGLMQLSPRLDQTTQPSAILSLSLSLSLSLATEVYDLKQPAPPPLSVSVLHTSQQQE